MKRTVLSVFQRFSPKKTMSGKKENNKAEEYDSTNDSEIDVGEGDQATGEPAAKKAKVAKKAMTLQSAQDTLKKLTNSDLPKLQLKKKMLETRLASVNHQILKNDAECTKLTIWIEDNK